MTTLTPTIVEIIESLDHLTIMLARTSSAIQQDGQLIAWLQDLKDYQVYTNLKAREKTIQFIQQIEYTDDQKPRDIILAPGYVGASAATLQIIEQLNQAKISLKEKIVQYKKQKKTNNQSLLKRNLDEWSRKRHPDIASALTHNLRARLHLKQCYRILPVLKDAPSQISWTWANTRAIQKIDRDDAHKLLLKKGQDEGIQYQIKKLSSLPQNSALAIVQDLAPHLRANLVYSKSSQGKTERQMIKGGVPIFFPAEPLCPTPAIKPIHVAEQKKKTRMTRSDVKIEAEPFLPAIRAHRYNG